MEKWDDTPEGMWRIVGELSQFFLERDVNSAARAMSLMMLFLEMHCRHFPEDRMKLGEAMMRMVQDLMTNHQKVN